MKGERKRAQRATAAAAAQKPTWFDFSFYPAVVLLVLAWCAIHPLMDPDIWLHMAFGRYVLEHRSFPPGDIFSFTAAGREWTSSGWAASVLFQMLYKAAGAPALVLFVFAAVGAVYAAIFISAVRYGRSAGIVAILLIAGAAASYLRFTPRPEVFSQVFLAAVLLVLKSGIDRLTEGKPARRLWALPALFALWANFHAGFLVGLVPVALAGGWFVLNRRRIQGSVMTAALLPLGLCFITWLLNPYGYELALLSGKIKALPHVRQLVNEWKPMIDSHGVNVPWPTFIGILVLIAAAGFSVLRNTRQWWEIATVALFAGLPFHELRHTALAAVTLTVFTSSHLHLNPGRKVETGALPVIAALLAGGIIVLQYFGLLHFGRGLPSVRLDDSLLPYTATKFLHANRPPENLYNSYGPGGYLMYNLGPETKVFMDGRNDVYPVNVWNDFFAIQEGAISLDDATAKYGLNSFFIYCKYNTANANNLANRLTAHPQWKLVYFDDSYALYVRETEQTREYVRQREFRFVSPFMVNRFYEGLDNPDTRPAVFAEVERALEISAGSAKAHLLAGTAAREKRDEATAARHFEQARLREPSVTVGQ